PGVLHAEREAHCCHSCRDAALAVEGAVRRDKRPSSPTRSLSVSAADEAVRRHVSAVVSASPGARGPRVLAPVGRADGGGAGTARDRSRTAASRNPRTTPRPAHSTGGSDALM